MKTLMLFLLLSSSVSYAEKQIPWDEVVSAFTWIKVGPDFPVVLTAESDEQVSFRIFADDYTITRDRQEYRIKSGSESVVLQAVSFEKILKFVKAKNRGDALLNEEYFQSSIRPQTPPEGFQDSSTIYQCASDLPARKSDGTIFNHVLQHTWLQNGVGESFGMPNTDEATYFGGRAHIRTPDSFIVRGPKHLLCAPIWIPQDTDQKKMAEKITCVARSLSLPQDAIFEKPYTQDWAAHFDYHVFERNCLMATRFVLECAGAKVSVEVNGKIGGKFEWSDRYSVSEVTEEWKNTAQKLRAQLRAIRNEKSLQVLETEALPLIDEAIVLDLRLRGVSFSASRSLREICDLSLLNCSN